jgi:hypothetical protein
MTDLADFPDVELALLAVLGDLVGGADHISVSVLADTGGALAWLPFLRVTCFGGTDDLITDLSRVDVDAFAATRAAAKELAGAARQRLLGKPHVGDGWVLDHVRTDVKPHYVPYVDSPPPYRYTAAYSVTARRPVSPL